MMNGFEDRMKKAMDENIKTDKIALKTLGLKSVEEFISLKLSEIKIAN